MLESHQRQQEYKWQQERERMRSVISILDSFGIVFLNNLFPGDNAQTLHLQDVFPALFQQEKPEDGEKLAADMEIYKAQRLYHAFCFNQSRKERE